MSDALSFAEIDSQHVELLPARTVLSTFRAGGGGNGGQAGAGGTGTGGVGLNAVSLAAIGGDLHKAAAGGAGVH